MKFRNILGRSEKANIEKIQSDFVTLASHQLRTPLSAVKWYTEMLMRGKGGGLSDNQHNYLREIYRSNERAINLVNDLLDVSRIQEGEIHLELRETKVSQVIEEVLESLETLSRTSRITVGFELKNGPIPDIETDKEKLKRVIFNLLSNAIKYTPAEGSIKITVEKNKHHIHISVEDSGVGIPKEEHKKIFSKFFRGLNVIKMAPDGTGLGLFIAKSLIEAMGGEMGFQSTEGKGTTFRFSLPIKSK